MSFRIAAPLPTYGPYDLLYLGAGGDDDSAVMYREVDFFDEIVEARSKADDHRFSFDELWNASMDERTMFALVHDRLATLTNSLRRSLIGASNFEPEPG